MLELANFAAFSRDQSTPNFNFKNIFSHSGDVRKFGVNYLIVITLYFCDVLMEEKMVQQYCQRQYSNYKAFLSFLPLPLGRC